MSTTVTAPRSGLARWSALGGAAYVVLFTAGVLIKDSGVPDFDANPAKVIDYYSDSGHRDKIALGWGLAILGIFFFVWFLAALRQFLARIDGDGFLTTVATIGGAIYAATSLTGISLETAVQTMSDDTFRDQVYPGLIHGSARRGLCDPRPIKPTDNWFSLVKPRWSFYHRSSERRPSGRSNSKRE